jgi:hypothetical protein
MSEERWRWPEVIELRSNLDLLHDMKRAMESERLGDSHSYKILLRKIGETEEALKGWLRDDE